MHTMHIKAAAFLSATFLLWTATQTSAQPVYKCSSTGSSRRTLTNFDGIKFKLNLTPPSSSLLQQNMDCGILLVGYSSSRWLITIDSISMAAYQAQFVLQDGGIGGRQLAVINASQTTYRQIVTNGTFYVRLTTQSYPTGVSSGVQMTIEHLGQSDCPSDWTYLSGGYCYGVPKLVGNLSYNDATKGCNLLAANLVMGNSDYDSISAKLSATTSIDSRVAYWVGMFQKDGELKYLNKYNTLDATSGRLCSSSSSNCNCVAYQYGKFLLDDCNSRRPYVCYMPRGGTTSYYDIDGLISTASAVITIVAIVLTVGFILCVLVSLIIVLICCARRAAETRRNRRQAGTAATSVGYPNPPAVVAATLPPPYPTDAGATAPPYAVYTNLAFTNAGNQSAEDKPPAYNPEWTGHQGVPA